MGGEDDGGGGGGAGGGGEGAKTDRRGSSSGRRSGRCGRQALVVSCWGGKGGGSGGGGRPGSFGSGGIGGGSRQAHVRARWAASSGRPLSEAARPPPCLAGQRDGGAAPFLPIELPSSVTERTRAGAISREACVPGAAPLGPGAAWPLSRPAACALGHVSHLLLAHTRGRRRGGGGGGGGAGGGGAGRRRGGGGGGARGRVVLAAAPWVGGSAAASGRRLRRLRRRRWRRAVCCSSACATTGWRRGVSSAGKRHRRRRPIARANRRSSRPTNGPTVAWRTSACCSAGCLRSSSSRCSTTCSVGTWLAQRPAGRWLVRAHAQLDALNGLLTSLPAALATAAALAAPRPGPADCRADVAHLLRAHLDHPGGLSPPRRWASSSSASPPTARRAGPRRHNELGADAPPTPGGGWGRSAVGDGRRGGHARRLSRGVLSWGGAQLAAATPAADAAGGGARAGCALLGASGASTGGKCCR